MAKHPKYQYADMDKLRKTQKEALGNFPNRVEETFVGAAEGVASDHINNLGNATCGEAMRQNQQMSGEIKAWEDTISAYQDALNHSSSTKSERETAQTVIDDLQRRIDAYQSAYGSGGANERAAQSVWGAADRLDDIAKQNIESAKQGLGTFGRGVVDFGVVATELLSDKLVSPAALYAKLFRLAGRDSQAARRSGADYNSAMSYGGASGFSGAAIETLFDGLGGAYGKGSVDEKIAEKMDKMNNEAKKRVRLVLPNLGEGFESAVTDLSNQALKQLFNQKNVVQNLSETDLEQFVNNVVDNTILAFLIKEKDR